MEATSENKNLTQALWDEISTVQDPELFMGLVELGLIYEVEVNNDQKAEVKMTLTSMGCPAGPQLQADVKAACLRVSGIQEADVEIVWSPTWDPHEMASEDVQIELGIA